MAPRAYDRSRRDEAMAETRQRIVDATIALHAEQGSRRTTYAMIAERADVAIPTVYNYFPTLTDLFGACITDTASRAPVVGPKTLAGTSDPGRRLAALVPALFARYRFLAPWLRWSQHEAHLIPELGAFHARFREQHLQLIRDAIAPRGGGRASAVAVGLVEVLTGYSSWETLTQDHGLSDDQAAAAVLSVLRPIITAKHEAPRNARKHRATASQRGRAT
jgi:AcrR family transcriptional regulator